MEVPKQQAPIAGLLYLLVALSAPLGLLIVPSEVVVSGDATATAEKIRNSVSLVRAGIASERVHQILAVFLVLALSGLFKPTHEALAKQLVIFGALLSVPIVFVDVLNEVAALALVSVRSSSRSSPGSNWMRWPTCVSACTNTGSSSPLCFGASGSLRLVCW